MRNKFSIFLLLFLLSSLLLSSLALAAGEAVYTNSQTGYKAYIQDDADLLTEEEEAKLAKDMRGITAYGGVAFVSVDTNPFNTQTYAEELFRDYFSHDSGTLFIVDMDNRNIWIYSDGAIYRVVTKSYANTITDNVYTYARDGKYYECAKEVFAQELRLLEGGRIAQPMKYISLALVSIVLAVLINFTILRTQRSGADKKNPTRVTLSLPHVTSTILGTAIISRVVRHYSSDSGSSGGGGGGGFSGGGGGGGHSGGGGGHSF